MEAMQGSGNQRTKSLLGIYAFAVCFMAVVGIVVCAALAMSTALNLSSPRRALTNLQQYESNDAYFEQNRFRFAQPSEAGSRTTGRPTEDELTRRRTDSFERDIRDVQWRAQNTLIDIAIWLAVLIPTFLVHWRFAKREQARA